MTSSFGARYTRMRRIETMLGLGHGADPRADPGRARSGRRSLADAGRPEEQHVRVDSRHSATGSSSTPLPNLIGCRGIKRPSPSTVILSTARALNHDLFSESNLIFRRGAISFRST